MWRPGTTDRDRELHLSEVRAWALGVLEEMPEPDRRLVAVELFEGGGADTGRRSEAVRTWVAAVGSSATPPPRSEHWDPEPIVDIDADPRLSDDDRMRLHAMALRARDRLGLD